MSYSIDANILLSASDQESPHHERAKQFLETRGSDPVRIRLSWVTLIGDQRLATCTSSYYPV